jgi:hypothetical protein
MRIKYNDKSGGKVCEEGNRFSDSRIFRLSEVGVRRCEGVSIKGNLGSGNGNYIYNFDRLQLFKIDINHI